MRVLVSDTSVLIDIERASLAGRLFELPHTFVVPDLLYERELADDIGPELLGRGLLVEELSGAEVAAAARLQRTDRALSVPDTFAFSLALGRGWVLLTGDGALRRRAETVGLPMHGVLWLLDELEAHAVCERAELHVGLTQLSRHPRCRLPKTQISLRLTRYQGG